MSMAFDGIRQHVLLGIHVGHWPTDQPYDMCLLIPATHAENAPCVLEVKLRYSYAVNTWIKSISNQLYITFNAIASQLSGHCGVISNLLWRHQQNVNRASGTLRRFIVIYGFFISYKKWKKRMYCRGELFMRSLECHFGVYFPRCCATRNSGNKHQNNPLMSA